MRQAAERPISPHLQIYRPQLTSVMSICHRASGIALSLGTVVLAFWVIAAAAGPEPFAAVNGHLVAWYGQLLLFFWSFGLFYHLCNGIRHLLWDSGKALDLQAAYLSGYIALACAGVLTLAAWLIAAVAS